MRSVHEFVDRDLRRSRGDWDQLSLPEPLRALADRTWQAMTGERGAAELDALRAAYTELYAEAEALAHSSIAAARQKRPAANRTVAAALRRRAVRALRR
jgi:hypothetical protein